MPYGLSPTSAADSLKGRALGVGVDQASAGLGGSRYLPVDLRALTAEAFGYSALRRYQVTAASGQEGNDGFYAGQGADAGPAQLSNMFGLPVFLTVQLGAAFNPATTEQADGVTLLDPLVSVSEPYTIIKTSVPGRRGTVKEYIGRDDLAVSVRGILATPLTAPDRAAYPTDQVQALRRLCALGVPLPVAGALQEVFGISTVVVQNLRFEALPGFTNLQAYELELLSDDPIELVL